MARKRKEHAKVVQDMKAIAKNNPQVDEKVAAAAIELINTLRRLGVRPKGFNLRGVSDSRLKVRTPVVLNLKK